MRFGILVAITLAFPFFVYGLVKLSGAQSVGGASGALTLVLGLYLKPLIYLAFTYSTGRISLGRARTIGISPMIGLSVPILVLADLPFGTTFGSFWAVGFSLGILSTPFPASLIAAVILATTLSLLPENHEPMTGRLERLYGVWKILLFIVVGLGLVGILQMLSLWFFGATGMNIRILVMRIFSYLRALLIYPTGLLLAFAVLSVLLVRESRQVRTGGGGHRASNVQVANKAPLFGQPNR
ncbi:hypothetical protein AX760_08165 [Pararhizobium antarcticum]|uniref:Uncharacterized protein n=2 Tax=Pararhizobium antarcticum TaxID=1798805 RepID=A0A657LMP0_9HYPH|nr:hypothetical protein AX760_08165 [Pararhizobium antarcticum]OJF98650.1 hypothetical protein AX761_02750 [Rhizobium sp. 58]